MLIATKNATVKFGSKIILDSVSFNIVQGKQYAVVGPSGSGKTTLLRMLAGYCFHSGTVETMSEVRIALVEQQHQFKNLSNTSSFYYQQRYNSADADDSLTVGEYLNNEFLAYKNGKVDEEVSKILSLLQVNKLMERKLIQLSNGENKRVQLVKALLLQPQVLLLDNAFVGLDQQARAVLAELLESIARKGITVVLVTSAAHLPDFITTVLQLTGDGQLNEIAKHELEKKRLTHKVPVDSLDTTGLQQFFAEDADEDFEYAIRMNKVHVRYHGKQILQDISWEVKKGDRWALSGANGAGKSTLLSLINADNPQAYANEIYLFDRRRGRGESIWDIKKRIGYVSPELHLYFDPSATAFDVIASGLFDTIGLFRKLNEEQMGKVNAWIDMLRMHHLQYQLLRNLPLGLQRLILLGRALIKNPSLLLLDEPAQGLDEEQAFQFRDMVEQICEHSNKTLVYISHYKEEIPACVTKFIHLEEGKISFIKE